MLFTAPPHTMTAYERKEAERRRIPDDAKSFPGKKVGDLLYSCYVEDEFDFNFLVDEWIVIKVNDIGQCVIADADGWKVQWANGFYYNSAAEAKKTVAEHQAKDYKKDLLRAERGLAASMAVLKGFQLDALESNGIDTGAGPSVSEIMLAALKDVAHSVNMQIDADDPDDPLRAEINRITIDRVFAAIAKATGQ